SSTRVLVPDPQPVQLSTIAAGDLIVGRDGCPHRILSMTTESTAQYAYAPSNASGMQKVTVRLGLDMEMRFCESLDPFHVKDGLLSGLGPDKGAAGKVASDPIWVTARFGSIPIVTEEQRAVMTATTGYLRRTFDVALDRVTAFDSAFSCSLVLRRAIGATRIYL
ncbi:hypothetical protein V8E36_006229, partial [Tilletia maclaganii]